ncbi:MAG: hypothetical protein JWP91_126 [Fibrobacteres bacterium]|nr:hypothetical protein [Fibrobacterota bacterium]
MSPFSAMSLQAALLLVCASAWAGPDTPVAADRDATKAESLPAKTATSGPSPSAAQEKPLAGHRTAMRINPTAGGYIEHAPLALFSLGSLAIGGVFYAIQNSSHGPHVGYTAGDRSSLATAVGAAGLTALLAAGSYLYFARESEENGRNWDAQVSGGVSPDGGMSVGALLTLPLPSLSR